MTPDAIRSALAGFPGVRLAILYGSLARGAARPESDLDLAVMGDLPLTPDDTLALVRALGEASGRPVDLVDLRAAGGGILHEILRTGTRVLERDPALYPTLLARHLVDDADFGPLHDRILADRRHAWTGA